MKKMFIIFSLFTFLAFTVFSNPKPITPEWLEGRWKDLKSNYVWEFILRPDKTLALHIYDEQGNKKYSWWCKYIAEEFYAVYAGNHAYGMNINYVDYDKFYFNTYTWEILNPNLLKPKFPEVVLTRLK